MDKHVCREFMFRSSYKDPIIEGSLNVSYKVKTQVCKECGTSIERKQMPIGKKVWGMVLACPPTNDLFIGEEWDTVSFLTKRCLSGKSGEIFITPKVLESLHKYRVTDYWQAEAILKKAAEIGIIELYFNNSSITGLNFELSKIKLNEDVFLHPEQYGFKFPSKDRTQSHFLETVELFNNALTLIVPHKNIETIKQGVLRIVEASNLCSRPTLERFIDMVAVFTYILPKIAVLEKITLRELSTRIFGDSKRLAGYIDEIESFTGVSLAELGITQHLPYIACAGSFSYKVLHLLGFGWGGLPYIVLTESTVDKLEFENIDARFVLLIENKTCFEEVAEALWGEKCILLYTAGFLSSGEKTFILELLKKKNLPVYGWFDIDPAGFLILKNANEVVREMGGYVIPILMDMEAFEASGHTRKEMTVEDKLMIERITEPFDVVDHMHECMQKAEQESILGYGVEWIKNNLLAGLNNIEVRHRHDEKRF